MPSTHFKTIVFENTLPLDVPGDTALGWAPHGKLFCPLQVIVRSTSLMTNIGDTTITVLAKRGVDEHALIEPSGVGLHGGFAGVPPYLMTFQQNPNFSWVTLNGDFVYTARVVTTTGVGGVAQVLVVGFLTPGDDQV